MSYKKVIVIMFILSEEERFISCKLRKRLIFTAGGCWTARKLSNISPIPDK
jgi:hypothetical protein